MEDNETPQEGGTGGETLATPDVPADKPWMDPAASWKESLPKQLWQCGGCKSVRQWGHGGEPETTEAMLVCLVCGLGTEHEVWSPIHEKRVMVVTLHTAHSYVGVR